MCQGVGISSSLWFGGFQMGCCGLEPHLLGDFLKALNGVVAVDQDLGFHDRHHSCCLRQVAAVSVQAQKNSCQQASLRQGTEGNRCRRRGADLKSAIRRFYPSDLANLGILRQVIGTPHHRKVRGAARLNLDGRSPLGKPGRAIGLELRPARAASPPCVQ